jgi:hypothetical protein
MHRVAELTVFILFALGIYLALPAAMILGWVRWMKWRQPQTLSSILSLIGFTLATASGLLAISLIVYSLTIGGFAYYAPLLLRIYAWGGVLSLAGIVFAISGVWRPNPLRWYAPSCAVGMLKFWLIIASGE